MGDLPFGGPLGHDRTAAEWAALHAGVEFLPANERKALLLSAQGFPLVNIATRLGLDPLEVQRMMQRSARTLITWERNACKWSTRYVAREPWSEEGRHWRPGDSKTQDAS